MRKLALKQKFDILLVVFGFWVIVAAKRARQLERGAEPTVARSRASKSAVVALREIAKGDISPAEITAKELDFTAEF